MKINLLICLFLFLFSSCEDYMEISGTKEKLIGIGKAKYGLECVGSGVAAPGIIKNFILHFDYIACIDLEIARKLLIDYTEDCVSHLKSNKKLQVHLENLPASENHLYFMIIFKDKRRNICSNLSSIVLSKGQISYSRYDNRTNSFVDFFKESYLEAYNKVYGTQPPERN